MKKVSIFLDKHLYDIFLVFLTTINLTPLLAPVLAKIGLTGIAHAIYLIYSFFCHQFNWRSLYIFDYQVAWCTRDVFIWAGLLLVALFVKKYKVQQLPWYWLIPFTIPIALDGGIQTVATVAGFTAGDPLYMSTNVMRMITGAIFGIGLGLWLLPRMKNLNEEN